MVGQFSELERKSIEPIALNVEDGNVRPMQRFISDAQWNDNKILNKYHSLVNEDMGTDDGVLIFKVDSLKKENIMMRLKLESRFIAPPYRALRLSVGYLNGD